MLDLALGLFEPLAVDLRFGLRFAEESFLDEESPIAHATWHVRREDLDDGRGLRPAFQRPGHQERREAVIDAHSIERIVGEALVQPVPPERRISFVVLDAKNLRVRLLDPELAAMASIAVWRGQDEYAVPVVHDQRGSWIDTIPDALERPLWLTVDNIDGTMRVKLYIAWSLWRDQGSPEQRAILDLARKMVAGGYIVDSVAPELRAGLGS